MSDQSVNELKKLAGKHLGKAGDGSYVKPYKTPEKHDKTLLVPLPRNLNRDKSKINGEVYKGFDVWHAYEMSFLYRNGQPCTGVLKTVFDCNTKNMVESKSFKLYLNSFDLECFESIAEVESIIEDDLREAVGGTVEVTFHEASKCKYLTNEKLASFDTVDKYKFRVDTYQEDSTLLQEMDNPLNTPFTFHTANLRSNCEITNQKDTGNCYIYIESNKVPTTISLGRYIYSFRNSQHFHENATEIIYSTLNKLYTPDLLLVANIYNRRGGLDIQSFRANSHEALHNLTGDHQTSEKLYRETPQQ